MCQYTKVESLAAFCKPDWIEGQPLPDGLSQHNFERIIKGANAIRQFKDDEWRHYEDYSVGFAGLGFPDGGTELEMVLARNKKHKAGECQNKTCAEAEAERRAILNGIKVFDFGALIAPQRDEGATNRNFDLNPWCGQCRHRNWGYHGVFKKDTLVILGRPFEENSGLLLMAWQFGRLTEALGDYPGYWDAGK